MRLSEYLDPENAAGFTKQTLGRLADFGEDAADAVYDVMMDPGSMIGALSKGHPMDTAALMTSPVPVLGDLTEGANLMRREFNDDESDDPAGWEYGLAALPGGMATAGMGVRRVGRLSDDAVPLVDRDMSLMQRVGDSDSVNGMDVKYSRDHTGQHPVPSAEDLIDRPWVATMADTSRGDLEVVESIDDVDIGTPMHGGSGYATQPENIEKGLLWGSADTATSGIMNGARAATEFSGSKRAPAHMTYQMMGTSPDFSTMTGEVMIPYAQTAMSKTAKKALDKRIRGGVKGKSSAEFAPIKDWPGIDSPDALKFMQKIGAKRKVVSKALDEFRDSGSLNLSQARAIITDPEQIYPQLGRLMNVGELDMGRAPTRGSHPSYSHDVPGEYIGRLGGDFNIMEAKPRNRVTGEDYVAQMHSRGHDLSGEIPAAVGKSMQTGLMGVFDQEIIDEMIKRGLIKP